MKPSSLIFVSFTFSLSYLLGFPTPNYSVPVSAGLETWSNFYVPDAKLKIKNREGRTAVQLKYTLPPELLGQEGFELEGEARDIDISKPFDLDGGLFTKCHCEIKNGFGTCDIKYDVTLPVTLPGGYEKAIDYLKKKITDASELEKRLKVLDQFVHGIPTDVLDGHEAGGTLQGIPAQP